MCKKLKMTSSVSFFMPEIVDTTIKRNSFQAVRPNIARFEGKAKNEGQTDGIEQ